MIRIHSTGSDSDHFTAHGQGEAGGFGLVTDPPGPHGTNTPASGKLKDALAEEALLLWLKWNNAYERVTMVMMQPGFSQEDLEEHMDQMDQLRHRAAELSRGVLDRSC